MILKALTVFRSNFLGFKKLLPQCGMLEMFAELNGLQEWCPVFAVPVGLRGGGNLWT